MHVTKRSPQEFIDSIDSDALKDGRYLREIAAANEAVGAAEQQLADAVASARAAGDSWTMIGLVLGVSRQAAHKRFG